MVEQTPRRPPALPRAAAAASSRRGQRDAWDRNASNASVVIVVASAW